MGHSVDERAGSWYVAKCLGVFIYEPLSIILSIISTFAWKIWVLPLESVVFWPRLRLGTLRVKFANVTASANLHRWQEAPHLTKDLTVSCKRKTHGSNILCAPKNLQIWWANSEILSNRIKLWRMMKQRVIIYFTSTINQQMHLHNFHLKHFKTLKTTPTCFDLFRLSSGSFVFPC